MFVNHNLALDKNLFLPENVVAGHKRKAEDKQKMDNREKLNYLIWRLGWRQKQIEEVLGLADHTGVSKRGLATRELRKAWNEGVLKFTPTKITPELDVTSEDVQRFCNHIGMELALYHWADTQEGLDAALSHSRWKGKMDPRAWLEVLADWEKASEKFSPRRRLFVKNLLRMIRSHVEEEIEEEQELQNRPDMSNPERDQ